MNRTRISTTVDTQRLTRARQQTGERDSELFDRALEALLREFASAHERVALDKAPYDDDPDLAWHAPPGPPLPYDGAVPEDVQRLAAERRATYGP